MSSHRPPLPSSFLLSSGSDPSDHLADLPLPVLPASPSFDEEDLATPSSRPNNCPSPPLVEQTSSPFLPFSSLLPSDSSDSTPPHSTTSCLAPPSLPFSANLPPVPEIAAVDAKRTPTISPSPPMFAQPYPPFLLPSFPYSHLPIELLDSPNLPRLGLGEAEGFHDGIEQRIMGLLRAVEGDSTGRETGLRRLRKADAGRQRGVQASSVEEMMDRRTPEEGQDAFEVGRSVQDAGSSGAGGGPLVDLERVAGALADEASSGEVELAAEEEKRMVGDEDADFTMSEAEGPEFREGGHGVGLLWV